MLLADNLSSMLSHFNRLHGPERTPDLTVLWPLNSTEDTLWIWLKALQGNTVSHCLAMLPHSKKILYQINRLAGLSVLA